MISARISFTREVRHCFTIDVSFGCGINDGSAIPFAAANGLNRSSIAVAPPVLMR